MLYFGGVERNGTILKLNLRVRTTNTSAATLYACLGFGVEGRQSRAALIDGRLADSLQMGMRSDLARPPGGAIRRATIADLDNAWSVVHEAAEVLHARGIHQWHQNYPTRDTIQGTTFSKAACSRWSATEESMPW